MRLWTSQKAREAANRKFGIVNLPLAIASLTYADSDYNNREDVGIPSARDHYLDKVLEAQSLRGEIVGAQEQISEALDKWEGYA